ncbi:MAG: PcfJ domain-containing protein [Methylomonas sp.]|jgi:hypothetical protein|uniref:PcfJ domain-containing protein n=1 Tax=Methylomonas sp. TaxID=418 RepID=UPI0025E692AA|nr:PcfJ domain-containing protein [Methylomonas sp.]MCK9608656.1 PcfJ domain-containing protein [Methylomonas sp.]
MNSTLIEMVWPNQVTQSDNNRVDRQTGELLIEALQQVDLNDLDSVYELCQPYLNEQQLVELETHWYDRHPVLAWSNHNDIVQLTDYSMLFLEAHQQHHCVLTYRHELESQEYAIFKVLHPERATLGIERQPYKQRYQLDQLVAANNQPVRTTTRHFVLRWLRQAQP